MQEIIADMLSQESNVSGNRYLNPADNEITSGIDNVVSLQTGSHFGGFAAIDADGGFWVWGQPGHSINPDRDRPTKMMDNAAQVFLRFTETYVLTT